MNEIMERAKQYMDSLADGRDPIGGAAAPDDPALNQERLSKCFRYTAAFLQRELDGQTQPQEERKIMERAGLYMDRLSYGQDPIGKTDLPKNSVLSQKKLAVCFRYVAMVYRMALEPPLQTPVDPMTPDLQARIPYSQQPVPLRPFVTKLADLLWDSPFIKSFFFPPVAAWLHQEGYIAHEQRGGQTVSVPTQRGISAGLSMGTITGDDGTVYPTMLFTEDAQRLIVDHVGQILASAAAACKTFLSYLTPETCIRVRLDPQPVSLTEVMKQVNSLLPPELPLTLNAARINHWLIEKGLLSLSAGGSKYPTEQGKAIGIVYAGRNDSGTKKGIHWSENAQQYLVDHLREIVLDLYAGISCG